MTRAGILDLENQRDGQRRQALTKREDLPRHLWEDTAGQAEEESTQSVAQSAERGALSANSSVVDAPRSAQNTLRIKVIAAEALKGKMGAWLNRLNVRGVL
jgi:hypothetical protein